MLHQLTFSSSEFNNKRSKTRKEVLLSRMNELMSWDQLEDVIEPFYPKPGNGRRPYPLSTMFRIHCVQHWYNMSGPAMEDTLYEIASMRKFAGLSLDNSIPDRTTIMSFRCLFEKHKLSRQFFKEVNKWFSSAGTYLKEGAIVDATIIEVASSTKSKTKERSPEMYQTQKGNQSFFDLKAHIGVDARTGLTNSLSPAAANVHGITETANLLHGEECFVSAGSGYRGAQKREELKDIKGDWLITEISSKIRALSILEKTNNQSNGTPKG